MAITNFVGLPVAIPFFQAGDANYHLLTRNIAGNLALTAYKPTRNPPFLQSL